MRHLFTLFFLLALPARTLASAAPPVPMPVPWPGLEVTGPVRVRAPMVAVSCFGGDLAAPIGCAVTARFELFSEVGGSARLRGEPELLLVNGAPADTEVTIPPGQAIRVELRVRRDLGTGERLRDWVFLPPLWMRHVLLGESETVERTGDGVSGALVFGTELLIEGAVEIDARDAEEVLVYLDGREVDGSALEVRYLDVGLRREASSPPSSPIRHGGPLLGLGLRAEFNSDAGRFLLRAGYELALGEYVFGNVQVETDFESIMESVVLEAGTPSLLILLPGVFGGAGAVFRQLGNRDADAALRLRLGIQYPVVSFVGDFDYWPTIGDWTVSMVARFSI